jgi:hypothetical protein
MCRAGFAQTEAQPQQVAAQRLDHVRAILVIVYDDVYGGLIDGTHGIPPARLRKSERT